MTFAFTKRVQPMLIRPNIQLGSTLPVLNETCWSEFSEPERSTDEPCISSCSVLPNHVSQRASSHHRCHRSRRRQLLYAIASRFLSLLRRARHRVLTSAPPRAGFIFSMTSERQGIARAQSEGYAPPKPKLVRRHSTGDHVFLPDQNHKAAINAAKKNFGVPPETMQDREVFAILALLTMPV